MNHFLCYNKTRKFFRFFTFGLIYIELLCYLGIEINGDDFILVNVLFDMIVGDFIE
jgi:membrane-associated PAP2 superfamily phosphatase